MKYAIVTNPASGGMDVDQRRSRLTEAAQILGAEIYGLDTTTVDEFCECAHKIAAQCDILVAAGGDGTISDIINSIDTTRTPVAYLPLGTGNAMRYALEYKGDLTEIAMRIKDEILGTRQREDTVLKMPSKLLLALPASVHINERISTPE